MKNYNLTVFVLVLFAHVQGWGQNFGGPGAEWYYSGHNAAPPEYSGYIRFSHAGDTLVAGRSANLLLQQDFNYTGTLIGSSQFMVAQASDTVFLYRSDLGAFMVLYIFNKNAGDTLTLDAPVDIPGVMTTTYRVVVDSVGIGNFNGVNLKKYFTRPLDDFALSGVLVDEIGCVGWFFPRPVVSIPEGPGEIRCFANAAFSINFKPYPCDYRLNSAAYDADGNRVVKIYPNPAGEQLLIQSDQPIDMVEIVDLSARVITATNQGTIDTKELTPGLYVVRVKTGSGRVHIEKIIKM